MPVDPSSPGSAPASRPAPTKNLWLGWTILLFLVAYGIDYVLARGEGRLGRTVDRLFWEKGTGLFYLLFLYRALQQIHSAFSLILNTSALVAVVSGVLRPLWNRKRRIQPGAKLSAFAQRHPVLVNRVLPWVPGSLWVLVTSANGHVGDLGHILGSVVGLVGMAAAVRVGMARFRRGAPEAQEKQEEEDQGSFAAVAVTRATQAVVAGLALVSIGMAGYAAVGRSGGMLGASIFGYVLLALGAPTLFRRVSRVIVGIDGVLVVGSDRARFFGYATLTDARPNGADILLVRGERTILRLQLHDADANRAAGLAKRLRAAMDRAAMMRSEGADLLMQATQAAASTRTLGSGARGYRQPAMAREHLWELVEGPISDATARAAAAAALAPDMSTEERARLRVVVDKCAEPRVRVALSHLLEEQQQEEEEDVDAHAARMMGAPIVP